VSVTHLGWPDGIDLGPESVLLLKVSGSILPGANLRFNVITRVGNPLGLAWWYWLGAWWANLASSNKNKK